MAYEDLDQNTRRTIGLGDRRTPKVSGKRSPGHWLSEEHK